MFNHADIYEREANGGLKDFARIAEDMSLLDEDEAPQRFLWLTETVLAEIEAWEKDCMLGAFAEMVNYLIGGPVLWGDLREGNHLKPLNPLTGWVEFKVRTSPQVRIYGAFVDVDHFIAVHACLRKDQPEDLDEHLASSWTACWGDDAHRVKGGAPSDAVTNYRS